MNKHKSVLLHEVIENLNIKENGIYVDATLGYAGHSGEILKRIKKGFLFAFDQDEVAIKYSNAALKEISENFKIFHSNFQDMKDYIKDPVDGILFDLGVSSPQLDDKKRGFSYHESALLDMRMDRNNSLSAKTVVNEYSEKELIEIFFKYGEEKYSKSIAKNIINKRPIETTSELVEIIKFSVPDKYKKDSHPARKVFQAIRIEVNKELDILEGSLFNAFSLLKVGGRLCVITFHSLEDRIVKNVFRKLSEDDVMSKRLPMVPEDMKAKGILINKKVILPSEEEININKRSRSAKLRVIERIKI